MPFKIDKIESAILYDENHNPVVSLNDINSISFDQTLDSDIIFSEDNLRIHMISNINEHLTFEVTGYYTNEDL